MKKMIYIIVLLFSLGCANNASKSMEMDASESFEKIEEESEFSENDAYTLIIKQKLQEYIDKKALAKANPDFVIDTGKSKLLTIKTDTRLKQIDFITPFENVSDSIKKVTTRVVLEHQVDTILTFIKTSETEIDGEQLQTTKISFDTIKKK
jgi:hypothetical protein